MRSIIVVFLVAGLSLAASGPAQATSVLFSGDDLGAIDGTVRQATAVFTEIDGGMTVTLTNVAPGAVTGGEDILTGVFFNIVAGAPSLMASTALVPTLSTIVNAENSSEWWVTTGQGNEKVTSPNLGVRSAIAAGNVTGEWAYNGALAHVFHQPLVNPNEGPVTVKYGISATGLGDFGPDNLFVGNATHPQIELDSPVAPNGAGYGIIARLNSDLINSGIGTRPLIKDSVTFTMLTLTGTLDVMRIQDVWFQYGTSYTEPNFTQIHVGGVGGNPPPVPEPVTMAGVCLGLCGLAGYVRKRR
ncbi:MAG: PEP-CTERM sorting domain-containing protein [Chloroflexi bacterium]|nr:PEP-CTERM sorting domain-containing protein [Chloroflexota bacterium]